MLHLLIPVLLVASQAAETPGYPSSYKSTFLTPSLIPGRSSDGLPTALDTHCVGNGRTVACVVANVTAGSIVVTLRRADAQGSSSDTLTISQVGYTIIPNPFIDVNASAYSYNQTLDMRTASVFITAGAALVARVYVTTCESHDDPPCDTALLDLLGSEAFSLRVDATSVRPPTNWTYPISWNCFDATSAPDVFADPVPPGPLEQALVQVQRARVG
jgi:hypothetical protein